MLEESEKKDIEALENFLLYNPEMDYLEGLLSQFNIFETLNIVQMEVRHSNVIAWLLDPLANHGIGSHFLQQFLKYFVSDNKSVLTDILTIIDIEMMNFGDVEIRREWNNIDILIIINEDSKQFIVTIENKVNSSENSDQLKRYRGIAEKEFPDALKIYIYLTPESQTPSDEHWLCFNYTKIAEITDNLIRHRRDSLNENVEEFISQYSTILRRYIVGNSEVERICREIYKKHKPALDLIFQYKPDIQLEISEHLQKKIISTDRIISDGPSGKVYIRFTNEYFDNLIEKKSEGWTKSHRILLFEFQNYDERLNLHLIIGPGPDDIRNKIFDICHKDPSLFRPTQKILATKWQTVYQKKFLIKKDYENFSTMDDLEKTIGKKWDDFLSNDLPKIIKHFNVQWNA